MNNIFSSIDNLYDLVGGRLTFKRQLSVFLSFHYEDTELSFEHVEYFLQKLRKKCIKR